MGVVATLVILAAAGLFVWYRMSLDSGAVAVQSVKPAASPQSAQ
jgi:hypothetical protein